MTSAFDRMKTMQAAGFTADEIASWEAEERARLKSAGFSPLDIDADFGRKHWDSRVFEDRVRTQMADAFKPGEDGQPKQAANVMDALKAGLQLSTAGLVARGQAPDIQVAPDASRMMRLTALGGQTLGDIPAGVAGYMLGTALGVPTGPGALVVGGAGAFALPTILRETLMDAYTKGEFQSFSDFWDRASGILFESAKSYVTGAVTSGAGVAVKAAPIASPFVKEALAFGAEGASMVTMGKALEGQVPTAEDFIDAAIVMGGFKAATHVGGKLRNIYAKTGVTPQQVAADAAQDPSLAADIVSSDKTLPALYAKNAGIPVPSSTEIVEASNAEVSKALAVPVKETPAPQTDLSAARQKILDHIQIGGGDKASSFSLSALYRHFVDRYNPIKNEVKTLVTDYGDLPADKNPYTLQRLTAGTFGKADRVLEHGTIDANTFQKNGESLREILRPIDNEGFAHRTNLNGLRAYWASKRAVELEARGVRTGFDMEAARTVIKNDPVYEPIVRKLVDFQNRNVQYLRDRGVISDRLYEVIVAANKDFAPFHRVMDTVEETGTPSGVTNPIKKIKGSERMIVDPLESVIKNTYAFMAIAEKNASRLELLKLYEREYETNLLPAKQPAGKGGLPAVVEPAGRVVEPTSIEGPTPKKIPGVDRSPIDRANAQDVKFLEDFTAVKTSPEVQAEFTALVRAALPDGPGKVTVFRKGERITMTVPEDVAKAYNSADAETAGILTRILALPARTMRAGAVLSPDFIARNPIRDQLSAIILSKAAYNPISFLRGFWSLTTRDQHYQDWLTGGGANAAMVSMDRQYLQEKLFSLSKETGLLENAYNIVKTPYHFLRVVSELMENSTRLGEYRKVAAKLEAQGITDTRAIIQEAAFSSREVTLDFARMGASMRAANMIIPFLNAHIQGLDRIVRGAVENPVGFTAKSAAFITLPSVLLWWVNKDDAEIQGLPQWQKDLFWIVRTGKHLWRIPKPFELGIVFGSIPERLLDAYVKDNPKAFKELEATIVNSLVPNIMPALPTPILEQIGNRSFFTGQKVVPARYEGLLPEMQYTEYTTELTKAISRFFAAPPQIPPVAGPAGGLVNAIVRGTYQRAVEDTKSPIGFTARALTSPALLENYIRAWTGGVGMYVLKLADAALRKTGVIPDPGKPEQTLADIPGVRAFAVRYPSASEQNIQDFYDRYTTKRSIYQSFLLKAEEGDPVAMDRIRGLDPSALVQLDDIKETLGEHAQLIRMISQDPKATPAEKRQLIDSAYMRMIELSKIGNGIMDETEKLLNGKLK